MLLEVIFGNHARAAAHPVEFVLTARSRFVVNSTKYALKSVDRPTGSSIKIGDGGCLFNRLSARRR